MNLTRAAIVWITFLDLKGRIVVTYQAPLMSECKETTLLTGGGGWTSTTAHLNILAVELGGQKDLSQFDEC